MGQTLDNEQLLILTKRADKPHPLNVSVNCMLLRGEQTYVGVFAQSVPSVCVKVANI